MDGYQCTVAGVTLDLLTQPGLFSPRGLDTGTRFLIESTTLSPGDRVCDLGCGAGVVGIWAAKVLGPEAVLMLDSDRVAVTCAEANLRRNGINGTTVLQADGFTGVDDAGFAWILCNPPYHVDWAVPRHFIRKGFNRLRQGGRLALVVKRRDWYEAQLRAAFGGCRITEHDGYHLIVAERRSARWADG